MTVVETFFAEDLREHVTEHYRTLRDRDGKSIAWIYEDEFVRIAIHRTGTEGMYRREYTEK